ncbi:MAG: type II toxin-antitoxin system RelE/ParE family toxin [Treponema sp.]|jgi:mRNA interferase RelE/StbE|nr:type II toxin-antitoxin system RelE/ParE family toxin [Treponema sp.]
MKVIITKKCLKQIGKLDIQIADKVFQKLEEIRKMPNPRAEGKALQGNYSGFWRYRVGDYRILCRIADEKLTVFVVKVAHRKDVYK